MNYEHEAIFLDMIKNPSSFRVLEGSFGWENTCTWLAKYSKAGEVYPVKPTKAQAWLIKAWGEVEVPTKSRFYPNIEMWRNIKWAKK